MHSILTTRIINPSVHNLSRAERVSRMLSPGCSFIDVSNGQIRKCKTARFWHNAGDFKEDTEATKGGPWNVEYRVPRKKFMNPKSHALFLVGLV
jgi:hypothetical protein